MVKQSIQASQGHPAENQKLIFSGKILADDKTVAEYEIMEKDFLVVMVSKPKMTKAPKEEPKPAEAVDATPTKTAEAKPAEAAPAAPSEAPAAGPSSFLAGEAYKTALDGMVEMGFAREDAERAMRRSFNNPDRAVEYLMNGLPEEPATESVEVPAAAPAAAPPTTARSGNLFEQAAAAQAGGQAGGQVPGDAADPMLIGEPDGEGRQVVDFSNPATIERIRSLIETNPAALQPVVQALVQAHPQLAEAMVADPEGVLNMIAGDAAGASDGEVMVPAQLDQLSTEDREKVEQIMAMGIPERKAIESYLMCGRNLEMAVQYYFEVRCTW